MDERLLLPIHFYLSFTTIPECHTNEYSSVNVKRKSAKLVLGGETIKTLLTIRLEPISLDRMKINAILTIVFRMTLVDKYLKLKLYVFGKMTLYQIVCIFQKFLNQ